MDFSKSIAACDLKIIVLMRICSIEGQGHILTLAQGHLQIKTKVAFQ